MACKKTLCTPIKRYLEHEVRHYNEYRRLHRELCRGREKNGAGAVSDSKDPLMAKAAQLLSLARAQRLEEFIDAFDRNYEALPDDMKKVIDFAYRSPVLRNKTGVAMECHMHPATAYRTINAFLTRVGIDLGVI